LQWLDQTETDLAQAEQLQDGRAETIGATRL
jgi:hypothetical protein